MQDVDLNRYLFPNPMAKYCPVRLTLDYFGKLGADFLGTVIPLCSPSDRNVPTGVPQGYNSCLQDLRYVLQKVGLDHKLYTEHSMRRGGATEAALNGATVPEITKAGCWNDSKTAEKYIGDQTPYQRKFADFLRN